MFTLELETGLAQAIEKTSTLLSTSIVRDQDSKSIFHSEFDNFDQLVSLTTGKDSAHGNMLQDVEGPSGSHSDCCCAVFAMLQDFEGPSESHSDCCCAVFARQQSHQQKGK